MTVQRNPRKGRTGWIYRFTYCGTEYKKEGYPTKDLALQAENEKRNQLYHPEKFPKPTVSFSELANAYLELQSKDRHQKNTYRQKAFVFRSFITFLKSDPAAENVDSEMIVKFMKARKDSNDINNIENIRPDQTKFLETHTYLVNRKGSDGGTCANRDLKELNTLFNWAKKHTKVSYNPCANVEKYGETKKDRYVPSVADINRVLLTATDFQLDLLQVLYHTAGRLSEALKLKWDDVNFQHRWVQLWTRKRKNGELQADKVSISETLYKCLKRRWEERDKESMYVFPNLESTTGHYTKDDKIIKNMMTNLCERAGVKRFTFHAIRHYVAMLIVDSNKATLRQVQTMLRHQRITTTAGYLKSLRPDMGNIVDILDESASKAKSVENHSLKVVK